MQYGFFYDQSRCIGCNACSVACKDWNQVNPGPVRWRKQECHETNNDRPVFENLTMSCNHCADPACMKVCSAGAITKTEKGIVIVDRTKCQQLRACINACPFSAPHIAEDAQEPIKRQEWTVNHPMQKCKFCYELVKDGGSPVCVSACPVHALDYGDIDDLERKHPDAVRLNETDFPYAYSNKNAMAQQYKSTVNPSFLIKKRKPFTVTKNQG